MFFIYLDGIRDRRNERIGLDWSSNPFSNLKNINVNKTSSFIIITKSSTLCTSFQKQTKIDHQIDIETNGQFSFSLRFPIFSCSFFYHFELNDLLTFSCIRTSTSCPLIPTSHPFSKEKRETPICWPFPRFLSFSL